MSVELISVTPSAEQIIGYCARVSNPKNQDNPDVSKLLSYCIKHGHWSVFEMANLCIEITTSRAMAAQILRHRSFSFQEFSQRYSEVASNVKFAARRQDVKNKQNSIDDMSEMDKLWFDLAQDRIWNNSFELYREALDKGIAKEVARGLLPLSTETTLYMNGTVRSWLTYFLTRLEKDTQKEHRDIARECYFIFKQQLPIIAKILEQVKPELFV